MKNFLMICFLMTSIQVPIEEQLKEKQKTNEQEKKPQLDKPVHKCPPIDLIKDNIIVKSCR